MGRGRAPGSWAIGALGAQALRAMGAAELKERGRRRERLQAQRRNTASGAAGAAPAAPARMPLEPGGESRDGAGAEQAGGAVRSAAARLAHALWGGAAGLQAAAGSLSRAIPKPPGRPLEEETIITSIFAIDPAMVLAGLAPAAAFAAAYALACLLDGGAEKGADEPGEGSGKLLWALRLVAVAYAASLLDGALEPQSPLRSALISGI
mmetsp:Transcript_37634/g.90299  ORF Transcript_37634/g.90299 Transcript_37634/m.90299 type:complete len:208 (+) Transcript_37634:169-792(+)